jgi:hypothetical protein
VVHRRRGRALGEETAYQRGLHLTGHAQAGQAGSQKIAAKRRHNQPNAVDFNIDQWRVASPYKGY